MERDGAVAPDFGGQQFAGGHGPARFPALRRTEEHLHQVIVHAIVEIALERPGELRVLDIARVQRRVIGVHVQAGLLELDHQLDGAAMLAGGEAQQGVIVAGDFRLDLFERRHGPMLA